MRDAAIDPFRQAGNGTARQRTSGAPSLEGMLDERPPSRAAKPAGRKAGVITSAAIAAQRLGGGRGTGPALSRGRASPGLVARLRGRLPRVRPFKAVTVGAFSLALVGIVANAMIFQRGHHPAPLFGLGQSIDGQADPSPRPVAALPPTPAPVPPEHTGTIAAAPAAAVEPAPPVVQSAPVHRPAVRPHHDEATGGAKTKAVHTAVHLRPGHAVAAAGTTAPVKTETKSDAVAKLLSEPVHAAKATPRPVPESKATGEKTTLDKADHDRHSKAATAPSHPHHRLAAAEHPAAGVVKAPKTE